MKRPAQRLALICALILMGQPMTATGTGFETPPARTPGSVIAADILANPLYTVHDPVASDGRFNTYSITAPFGDMEITGNDMLQERLQEAEAVTSIRKVRKTEAFIKAVGTTAVSPFYMAADIIRNPVRTIKDIPSGVGAFFTKIGDSISSLFGSDDEEPENKNQEWAKEISGFNKQKRRLAALLEVDPYTDNAVLQEELTDLTWVYFAGKTSVDTALSVAPIGAVGLVISGLKASNQLQNLLKESSPEDLLKTNQAIMVKLGLSEDLQKRFLYHDHCTPRHQTVLTHAMGELESTTGHGALFELAADAGNDRTCRTTQNLAELMAWYQNSVAALTRIESVGNDLHMVDDNGAWILPVWGDHLLWTSELQESLHRLERNAPPTALRTLLTPATLSETARRELTALGVRIMDRSMHRPLRAPKPVIIKVNESQGDEAVDPNAL
ncbi:MAG: hypothetical protein HQL50_08890 [Magnetococcales bacterium]|nr:hypothetical protein [Magnetococcales bacterium]